MGRIDEVLTTVQLAARWSINAGTLANWRCYKKGPVHVRVGNAIRYRLTDVIAYERANEITPVGAALQYLRRASRGRSKSKR